MHLAQHQDDGLGRVVFHHAVRRRQSLAGIPEMFRTHQIFGGTVMAVADIDTGAIFPSRTSPITFRTAIEITANAGVHKGLVFEFSGADIGAALWVGDQTIGFHAGEDGTVNGATALFDNTVELPVGLLMDLVVAIRPGDGRVRMWGNGQELARAVASSDTFGAAKAWAEDSNGSFAAAVQGTVVVDVPAGSQIAPDGFTVIEPLSIYVGQVPRHFV
jgi:hypothetical protein